MTHLKSNRSHDQNDDTDQAGKKIPLLLPKSIDQLMASGRNDGDERLIRYLGQTRYFFLPWPLKYFIVPRMIAQAF